MKKSKNILIKTLSILIALIISISVSSNYVYATSYQGNGGGKNDGSNIGKGSNEAGRVYATYARTGWLVYVVDTSGKLVIVKDKKGKTIPPVVYVDAGSSVPTGYNIDYLNPRMKPNVVASIANKHTNAPWGTPFEQNGGKRGPIIRNEIVKSTKQYSKNKTESNMTYIIKHYLGDKMYETVAQDPDNYYLILEACAYHSAYNGAGQKVGDALASAFGWAYLNKINGLPATGDGKNGWCDQYRLQRGCFLEKNWQGLPKAPTNFAGESWSNGSDGISTDYLLGNYGYGMIAIRANEGVKQSTQSTCNESFVQKKSNDNKLDELAHTSPNESEDGKDKSFSIVKTYLTKTVYTDRNGNELGDDYVSYSVDSAYKAKTDSIRKIVIEDESKASIEKRTGAKLKGSAEDYYSLEHWYVATGKTIEKEDYTNILTEDKTNTRFRHMIEDDNNKTVIKSGSKETYPNSINIGELKDSNGKSGKTVYMVLVKTVKKSIYQTTSDEKKKDPHKAPDESNGKFTIVKNYVTKSIGEDDITYIDDGCFVKTEVVNKIDIEDESGTTNYKIYKWKVTDSTGEKITAVNNNNLVWESNIPGAVKKSGKSEAAIDLKTLGGKTVYLLLIKEDVTKVKEEGTGDFIIPESSLTKRIRFSESNTTQILNSHSFKWFSEAFTVTSCKGHSYNCGGCVTGTYADGTSYSYCPGHKDYCSSFGWYDDKITVSLSNERAKNFKNIMVQINGWENVVKNSDASSITKYWNEFTRTNTGVSTQSRSGWDYVSVLWRGDDKLTIAKWKNDSATNQLMSNVGFAVADKPQGARETKNYIVTFAARFSEDTGSRRELSTKYGAFTPSPVTNRKCTQVKTYQFKTDTALNLNSIKVNVKVYSGQKDLNNDEDSLIRNQAEAGTITFYPYIKMKYDTYNMTYNNNFSQTAYVLGNYERTLKLRNYCSVSFAEDKENSLVVNSNQWSTHASTNDYLNELLETTDLTFNIIPGGAILDVQNKYDDNHNKYVTKDVNVITYQCLLEGDGKTQVEKTGSMSGDFTEKTAKERHNEAVDTIEEGFNNLGLDLYGNSDARKEPFDGENITEKKKFNGATLSDDKKYNWGSDFSDLLLNAESDDTKYEKYIFSCDTEGNIKMNNKIILKKGYGVERITDVKAKNINDRTGIVTQLFEALEHNTGKDNTAIWASGDGKWYNEAFDGVTILVSTTQIHVGYWDPQLRTTVFDTKLTPYQSDKMDIGKRFYSFQLKTKSYSEKYKNEKDRIGSFMGEKVYSNVPLNRLYKTNKWFSSSISTQDLH